MPDGVGRPAWRAKRPSLELERLAFHAHHAAPPFATTLAAALLIGDHLFKARCDPIRSLKLLVGHCRQRLDDFFHLEIFNLLRSAFFILHVDFPSKTQAESLDLTLYKIGIGKPGFGENIFMARAAAFALGGHPALPASRDFTEPDGGTIFRTRLDRYTIGLFMIARCSS